jgi:hypothetical protein
MPSSLSLTTTSSVPAFLCAALLLAASASAQQAAHPLLIPQPRELHSTERFPAASAVVTVPGGDAEDLFAARNLETALAERGVLISPAVGAPALTITLLHTGTPAADRLLFARKLAFDPAMHDEGYILTSNPGTVTIVGATAAGIFYGVQTLKQLVETDGPPPMLWAATIRDWPAMKYRGIHDDLSRGPFPTLAFQKHQLDVFAAYKVNLYSPYMEHTLQYAAEPLAAPPGSALTRAEARELAAYAANLHIAIVPEQEAVGHLHHVLGYEKYADIAESPHGHVIAPGQPGTLPLIETWFTQIAEDFPSPFLHIGADETFELGAGRTKSDVDKRGLGPVYADFLSSIHTTLAPLNRRLLFWGDIATSDPAAIPGLPKDMIAIPWIYWHQDNYDGNITPFKSAGIETWVAPGDANWNVVYPIEATALDNISGFIESGQRLGSTGELTTVWDDDGEGLFNQNWFGVLFGAAAGWQPGRSAAASYQAAFGRAFFGDTTGKIDEAQRELIAAEDDFDVSDKTFWLDPWSKVGQSKSASLLPKAHNARLHAERAIELIETILATNPGIRERDALLAMELGARRIDFIGMKFQLAAEIGSNYAKAYAMKDDKSHSTATHELLYSISSMNGRCQDLRDGYGMLKDLYAASWLAENRPYWLGNVLVRYDLQMQLWQRRGEDLDAIIDAWDNNGYLPTAHEAGIPVPPQP